MVAIVRRLSVSARVSRVTASFSLSSPTITASRSAIAAEAAPPLLLLLLAYPSEGTHKAGRAGWAMLASNKAEEFEESCDSPHPRLARPKPFE